MLSTSLLRFTQSLSSQTLQSESDLLSSPRIRKRIRKRVRDRFPQCSRRAQISPQLKFANKVYQKLCHLLFEFFFMFCLSRNATANSLDYSQPRIKSYLRQSTCFRMLDCQLTRSNCCRFYQNDQQCGPAVCSYGSTWICSMDPIRGIDQQYESATQKSNEIVTQNGNVEQILVAQNTGYYQCIVPFHVQLKPRSDRQTNR